MSEPVPLKLYTVDEARQFIPGRDGKPLGRNAMYQTAARGWIKTVRVGPSRRLIRFPGWALIEYIRGHGEGEEMVA
jgi:hypothetical protein